MAGSGHAGFDVGALNELGAGCLPGLLGIEIVAVERDRLRSRLAVRPELMAPNGYLHGASVVALAETTCGYATLVNLPSGAHSFATLELKSKGSRKNNFPF